MVELPVTLAGLIVGFVVGLTGMGGGALMTPILVLFFGMEPLAAVSSDLVASMFMKPIGAAVHLKRKTVHRQLVVWLVLGSVPSAFLGVLLLNTYGSGEAVQESVRAALGIALLAIALTLVVKPILARTRPGTDSAAGLVVKPRATLIIGIIGGLVVGLTSVGSGSLMMIMLLMVYPAIRLSELVGTDLVQAVPLVSAAALAHYLFGDFQLSVTASILLGSIPGICIGAHFSSRASDRAIRPLLGAVLLASALKLLGAGNVTVAVLVGLLGAISVVPYGVGIVRARAGGASEV